MQLLQHQIEGLSFLQSKKCAGLFFEQGLGKTLVMLEHLNRTRNFPCLVVAPLSVVGVWRNEIEKFGFNFSAETLIGTKQQRLEALRRDADIYLINYEGLRILEAELLNKYFSCIILDESHRISQRSSQQTTVALTLGNRIGNRYILTGTPMTNSPEGLWTQIHFIAPGFLKDFYSFRNTYIDFKKIMVKSANGVREVMKPYRFKNLKELQVRTEPLCLRKTKEECLDLPDKIYKTIPCLMGKEQQKHYYSLKYSLATMLNDKTLTVQHAASLVNKLRQICQGFVYSEAGNPTYFKENGKLSILKDLISDITQKDFSEEETLPEKIILLTYFKAELELLRHELGGYKVFVFEGNDYERTRIISEFQGYKGKCIFLANIDTAKEGITLTSANHVIFFGNSYSYGARAQVEDRAHRQGQVRNVIYYDLVCKNTIDDRVVQILKMKKHTADVVTGDSMRLAQMVVED